jgi:DNA-binding MarR family transcriptional regulator
VADQTSEARRVRSTAKPTRKSRAGEAHVVVDLAQPVARSGLYDHAGYLMRRAQLWIFQDFRKTLAPIDIKPAQYSVLMVVDAMPGLTQMSLARLLGIERARLVHLLDVLQSRGLVTREASAKDRRSHALHLTPEGRDVLVQARALAAEHERHVAERIGPQRRQELLQLLMAFRT